MMALRCHHQKLLGFRGLWGYLKQPGKDGHRGNLGLHDVVNRITHGAILDSFNRSEISVAYDHLPDPKFLKRN